MKQDKFLIAIVAGVLLLVVVAIVVVLTRLPGNEDYRPDDTPEGVAHNYFLAIQRKEFNKAYGYLSDELENKPSLEQFVQEAGNTGSSQEASLKIGPVSQSDGVTQVEVTVTTYSSGGLLDSSRYSSDDIALLRQDSAGQWKITRFPYPYWGWSWNEKPE
ncbi:MAG: hypothetical protein Kow0031_33470 [Anaerolineae bacterium]